MVFEEGHCKYRDIGGTFLARKKNNWTSNHPRPVGTRINLEQGLTRPSPSHTSILTTRCPRPGTTWNKAHCPRTQKFFAIWAPSTPCSTPAHTSDIRIPTLRSRSHTQLVSPHAAQAAQQLIAAHLARAEPLINHNKVWNTKQGKRQSKKRERERGRSLCYDGAQKTRNPHWHAFGLELQAEVQHVFLPDG